MSFTPLRSVKATGALNVGFKNIMKYPEIEITRKTGEERFCHKEKALDLSLLSFWQWSSSDLTNNAMRGILAEFIVSSAVDSNKTNRIEWDAYDVITKEGIKLEVKSGAYIQSWSQNELSKIIFSIRPTFLLNPETNTYSKEAERQSDIYVFCLLKHKEQTTINPLILDQWEFYVIPTSTIASAVGMQKTITLNSLKKLDPIVVTYDFLYENILKFCQPPATPDPQTARVR